MSHFSDSPGRNQGARTCAAALVAALAWAGCAPLPPAAPEPAAPVVEPAAPTTPPAPPAKVEAPSVKLPAAAEAAWLTRTAWRDLPGWNADNHALAWEPFQTSCSVLARRDGWREVCAAAQGIHRPDRETARRFFERHFTPYQLTHPDGNDTGLVTGYYEPLLRGSRSPHGRYRHPVFGVPDDLLVIDLASAYPELAGMQLRGRLEGRRIVPYYDRAQIEERRDALAGREIVWVDDPIELFFLQIQGSGRVALDTGDTVRLGYADQNGHPYRSIGRLLVEQGELPLEKASMQGIKEWSRRNPDRVQRVLSHNARYIFFRELPDGLPGPVGALGVPITAGRSVAIDPRFVALGAPVYLSTTWPLSDRPLHRLMLAQDTGGAITGAVRADFFWGFGAEAGREAGRMKQPLRMWVLLPSGL
jgi:membrane-bound lytic murein transglycosylase A